MDSTIVIVCIYGTLTLNACMNCMNFTYLMSPTFFNQPHNRPQPTYLHNIYTISRYTTPRHQTKASLPVCVPAEDQYTF